MYLITILFMFKWREYQVLDSMLKMSVSFKSFMAKDFGSLNVWRFSARARLDARTRNLS